MEPFQYQRHRVMDNDKNHSQTYRNNPTNMSSQILTPTNLGSFIHTTQNTPANDHRNENSNYFSFTRERTQEIAAPQGTQNISTVPNIYPSNREESSNSTDAPSIFTPQTSPTMPSPNSTSQNTPMMPQRSSSPQTTPMMPPPNSTSQNTPMMPQRSSSPQTTPMMPSPNSTPQNTPMMPQRSSTSQTTPMMPQRSSAPQTTPMMPQRSSTPQTTPMMPQRSSTPQTIPMMPQRSSAPQTTPMMPSPNSTSQNTPMMPQRSSTPQTTPMMSSPNMEVPKPRLDSQTMVSTPPTSPLKSFNSLEDCEIAYEKDLKYLSHLNSAILNLILSDIKKEFDLLDYDGSFIFDEFPDRNTLLRMAEIVLERVKGMDIGEVTIEATQFNRNDKKSHDPWLQYLIETLIFHELLERRRHKRRRGNKRREHRGFRY